MRICYRGYVIIMEYSREECMVQGTAPGPGDGGLREQPPGGDALDRPRRRPWTDQGGGLACGWASGFVSKFTRRTTAFREREPVIRNHLF